MREVVKDLSTAPITPKTDSSRQNQMKADAGGSLTKADGDLALKSFAGGRDSIFARQFGNHVKTFVDLWRKSVWPILPNMFVR